MSEYVDFTWKPKYLYIFIFVLLVLSCWLTYCISVDGLDAQMCLTKHLSFLELIIEEYIRYIVNITCLPFYFPIIIIQFRRLKDASCYAKCQTTCQYNMPCYLLRYIFTNAIFSWQLIYILLKDKGRTRTTLVQKLLATNTVVKVL